MASPGCLEFWCYCPYDNRLPQISWDTVHLHWYYHQGVQSSSYHYFDSCSEARSQYTVEVELAHTQQQAMTRIHNVKRFATSTIRISCRCHGDVIIDVSTFSGLLDRALAWKFTNRAKRLSKETRSHSLYTTSNVSQLGRYVYHFVAMLTLLLTFGVYLIREAQQWVLMRVGSNFLFMPIFMFCSRSEAKSPYAVGHRGFVVLGPPTNAVDSANLSSTAIPE